MYQQSGSQSGGHQRNPSLNNPFSSPASQRYPEITPSSNEPGGQFTSWLQPSGLPASPYQQQPQQQSPVPYGSPSPGSYGGGAVYVDPNQQHGGVAAFQPAAPTGYGFPAQSLGQAGSSYGYMSPQPQQQQQQQQYTPAQQQLQSSNYASVAALDPYSGLGQLGSQQQPQAQQQQGAWGSQPPAQQSSSSSATSATSNSPSGEPHPRALLRTHKTALESWDTYAWKQLLNSFDSLKGAWSRRKDESEDRLNQLQLQIGATAGYGYYDPGVQQESIRLLDVGKEAQGFVGKSGYLVVESTC